MTRLLQLFCCSLLCVLQIASAYAQVAPAPSLYNPNVWIGPNSSPPCVVANGATISVNALSCTTSPGGVGVDLNTITLTQNSTFAFPTGLPVKGNFKFGFRINHGTGPYTAQFAFGYQFPTTSMTNAQPVLSTSGTDYIWCVSEEGSPPTAVDCTTPMLAMIPAGVPLIAQTGGTGGTGTAATAISVNLTNFVSGHTAYALIGWCGVTGCNGTGTEDISTVTATGGSCSLITGTNSTISVANPITAYRCTGVSAGPVTVTANWTGAGAFWQSVVALEVSGDGGVEAGNVASGSGTAPAVTSGTLSQANWELAIADAFVSTTISALASPFTFVGPYGYLSVLGCSSCTKTATFTASGGGGAWAANVFGIKHK